MKREKLECHRGKYRISGSVLFPDGKGPFPLLIYSHGFGWNYEEISMENFAEHKIAACRFDFCGGSPFSRSSGNSLEMSVLTEADDLEAVLDTLLDDPRIDSHHVYLSGNSQGGYVSSVVGIRRLLDIRQMFLLCPAYITVDFREQYLRGKDPKIPFRFGNLLLSHKYLEGIDNYPVYEHMPEYTNHVTIYHGTNDEMVPMRYSERAAQCFPDAELIKISGAGHMLSSHSCMIEEDMMKKIQTEMVSVQSKENMAGESLPEIPILPIHAGEAEQQPMHKAAPADSTHSIYRRLLPG